VLMAPVVPGFTTQPARLEATIKACAAHGAAFIGANLLYLKGGTKDHFMGFLRHAFPDMVESYDRLYAGAYASPEYVAAVRGLIDMLRERHHVKPRLRQVTVPEPEDRATPAAPTQEGFDFNDL